MTKKPYVRTKPRLTTNIFTLSDDQSYYSVLTSSGLSFLIDADDYPSISSYSWYIKDQRNVYPVRDVRKSDTGYYREYKQIYLAYELLGVYLAPKASKGNLVVLYHDGDTKNLRRNNLGVTTRQEVAERMLRRDDVQSKRRKTLEKRESDQAAHLARVEALRQDTLSKINSCSWSKLTLEDILAERHLINSIGPDHSSEFDVDLSYFTRRLL